MKYVENIQVQNTMRSSLKQPAGTNTHTQNQNQNHPDSQSTRLLLITQIHWIISCLFMLKQNFTVNFTDFFVHFKDRSCFESCEVIDNINSVRLNEHVVMRMKLFLGGGEGVWSLFLSGLCLNRPIKQLINYSHCWIITVARSYFEKWPRRCGGSRVAVDGVSDVDHLPSVTSGGGALHLPAARQLLPGNQSEDDMAFSETSCRSSWTSVWPWTSYLHSVDPVLFLCADPTVRLSVIGSMFSWKLQSATSWTV